MKKSINHTEQFQLGLKQTEYTKLISASGKKALLVNDEHTAQPAWDEPSKENFVKRSGKWNWILNLKTESILSRVKFNRTRHEEKCDSMHCIVKWIFENKNKKDQERKKERTNEKNIDVFRSVTVTERQFRFSEIHINWPSGGRIRKTKRKNIFVYFFFIQNGGYTYMYM